MILGSIIALSVCVAVCVVAVMLFGSVEVKTTTRVRVGKKSKGKIIEG